MTNGNRPEAVLLAVERLIEDLATVSHLGRPDGWTDKLMRLAYIGESLGAVLKFLAALDAPLSSRYPILDALSLVVENKPRQRGGQKRNSGLICIAIQRLILAGMRIDDAIKDVSDKRIVRDNIANTNASLNQVKKYWAERENDESWLDFQQREKPKMTLEQAQLANDRMFGPLSALKEI